MKLAFSTLACPTWRFDEVIAAAQAFGYEGIELRLLEGELLQSDLSSEERRKVKKAIQQAGLPIISLGSSLCIAQPDALMQQELVSEGVAFLQLAAEWEVPNVRVFGYPPKDCPHEQARRAAIDALTALAPHAETYGVAVVLETHDAFTHLEDLLAILRAVSSPHIGVIWDIMNTFSSGESVDTCARELFRWISHVHIKDGLPPEWQCVLLGEGDVPIFEALRALKDMGYDGWLSVEWEKKWQPDIAAPEVALPQYRQVLQNYLVEQA